MNKFRANLHPAFFFEREGYEMDDAEREVQQAVQWFRQEEAVLETEVRRNNEALWSSVVETQDELKQTEEEVTKQLEKQLKQLAKNKKIDFPWTDNAWKCSRAEKRLATSSVKVFQQVLEKWKLQTIIEKCKSQKWELTEDEAEAWKTELDINSKTKDIQRFCKAYFEYQNPQSKFQHLKNVMGFICESGFEQRSDLVSTMKLRSEKISKQDIANAWRRLYTEWSWTDEHWNQIQVIIDNRTWEKIDRKPKDWEKRASFEVIKDRLANKSWTDRMLTLLWDFNLDGEVNSGDVGYKTWSQVVDVFRRTVATQRLEDPNFDDNTAVINLVNYANKFWMDIPPVTVTTGQLNENIDNLYAWMTDSKQWYENTTKLQNFLRNLPIELSDVLVNWEDAWAQSLENITSALRIEETERKKAEEAANNKAKEILSAGEARLKEVIKDDRERADITQQLLTQLPGMLIDKAVWENNWLAVGYGMPLDQIVKWMSAWFSVWIDSNGKPQFWLFVWWDRKFNLSNTTDLRTAISAGTKLMFVPCVAASMEIGQDVNKWKRDNSLDASGEHRVTLWWNVAVTWPIFSYGFSVWYESNKQRGIEKQAENINKALKTQALSRVTALKDLQPEEGKEEVSLDQKRNKLVEVLWNEFKKSSPETLETAANNLLSIIQWFKIDEKTWEQDFATYAQVIADVYSEQWRNAALAWIADNKRKLSWGKVWIQFIEWCVPVVTLVAKFTKHRNARTNETEHSHVARIDAQVNGQGNKPVTLEWKEIWKSQVDQINEALKRYGAKSLLQYIEWTDWKPGRIQVPASIADGIWINIRVSRELEWYVSYATEKQPNGEIWYQFPANSTYRLLQETWWNQRSVTLNIGSDKNKPSDIMISDAEGMKTLYGDKEIMWGKKLEYSSNYNDRWWIEYRPNIDSLFTTDVVEWLKNIDSSDRKKFSKFMKTKVEAVEDFNEMLDALRNVLWKDKKYEAILNQLNDENVSSEDKQLILDRIMAISAYTNVHDAKWLALNVGHRKDYYRKESMKGPNWKSIFDKLSVKRDDILPEIQSYDPVSRPDVFWATAFYNRHNKAKWLAMTWLGATNVLWWITKELSWDDKTKVENWFLWWNDESWSYVPWVLEKSPKQWDNLKRAIKDKLPDNISLSDSDAKKLLRWEEVELTLDNSQKKAKIKLDAKCVFYLMWECANESVGMELWNLQVQEQQEVDDYGQWSLYLNNGDGSSSVGVEEKNAAIGVAVWGKRKEKKEDEQPPEPPQKPKNDDWSDPSNWWGEWWDNTIPEVEWGEIGDENRSDNPNGWWSDNPNGWWSDPSGGWENTYPAHDEYDDF